MAVVVSDTSVITNLAQVGHLQILRELYGEIIVPQKVREELEDDSTTRGAIANIKWLKVKYIKDQGLYRKLILKIDPGEAEAIVLAKELNAGLLMIDEKRGRRIARENGILIVGVLGLLIDAKKKALIDKVKPILDKLIYEVGFRVSPKAV